ncbi:hypothetical protein NSB25_27410 [Acetatifactor muris]|uniref:Uncharacterized protein n=1 Tax=Acetatifactor muris TaxID=879566 RepID=A0A2K4ZQ36_9FIRM|nr:hypothetical protein [Acetatifactor muris]MCR2050954.1 hypothetical protein [Acetatifactor muris]SOY32462.1 hypothetical protein AMURIS_05227 [Acetatifactor muris]
MERLKDRLITAIIDYGNSDAAGDFDAEDMAKYLIDEILELHLSEKYKEEIFKEIDGVIVKDTYSKGKNAGLRKAWKIYEDVLSE